MAGLISYQNLLCEFGWREDILTVFAYEEISKSGVTNFIMAPFPAECLLALTYLGARGETAEEMRFALAYNQNTQPKIENAFRTIMTMLAHEAFMIKIYHMIFISDKYNIRSDYAHVANDAFRALIQSVSFENPTQAVQLINDRIEQQICNKFHNILETEDVNQMSKVILTNVAYFKSFWRKKFDHHLTQERDFYKNDNEVVQVQTMSHTAFFNCYENEGMDAKFLEIPFADPNASMIIVLPNKKEGLAAVENDIDFVLRSDHPFSMEYLNVLLPRFRIESRLNFKDVLQKFCVEKAFLDEDADFTGIAGEKGQLYINEIIQKVSIDVEEEGVDVDDLAPSEPDFTVCVVPRPEPKDFAINHPFIFYVKIRDLVVFTGRVVDPTYDQSIEM